ncbi:lytic transglycosylase domain-containing protein, partial [bacterium]|nr:lytic transglycosylase domain-containing protein [bacterium]
MKIKLVFFIAGLVVVMASVNWVYQVIQNPVILISMLGSKQFKSSKYTWNVYYDLFEEHSTDIMTAEFLGAMAQVESGGNPIVSPEWKWRLTTNVFRIYAPASTSVGLYQYTKPTFKGAKRFCIHNHKVVLDGFFLDPRTCWFNALYSRLSPSNSIEMTSARLHYYTEKIIRKSGQANASIL